MWPSIQCSSQFDVRSSTDLEICERCSETECMICPHQGYNPDVSLGSESVNGASSSPSRDAIHEGITRNGSLDESQNQPSVGDALRSLSSTSGSHTEGNGSQVQPSF